MLGHGSEGATKDWGNGTGPGIDVQGGGAVSNIIWQLEMGGDRLYAQVLTGIHHMAARCITGMRAKRGSVGEW